MKYFLVQRKNNASLHVIKSTTLPSNQEYIILEASPPRDASGNVFTDGRFIKLRSVKGKTEAYIDSGALEKHKKEQSAKGVATSAKLISAKQRRLDARDRLKNSEGRKLEDIVKDLIDFTGVYD